MKNSAQSTAAVPDTLRLPSPLCLPAGFDCDRTVLCYFPWVSQNIKRKTPPWAQFCRSNDGDVSVVKRPKSPYGSDIWKNAGWTMIIYLAAISSIDTEQYESAKLDGASRLQTMWYITLPGILNTIVVLLILQAGILMTAGFDQIFNLSNAATAKAGEILDMYIYRVTFQAAEDFSYFSAVSLFRSIINFVLLLLADRICKMLGADGLFPPIRRKPRKASRAKGM